MNVESGTNLAQNFHDGASVPSRREIHNALVYVMAYASLKYQNQQKSSATEPNGPTSRFMEANETKRLKQFARGFFMKMMGENFGLGDDRDDLQAEGESFGAKYKPPNKLLTSEIPFKLVETSVVEICFQGGRL